ncbi:UNC93-like protein MFSD11 [Macrosteles quadrilineatus]|nr:UNC93-like protein MFSD11 [Macrosteles quadrilineatus]
MILFSAEFAVLNMQKTIISSIHDERPDFKVEGYFVTGIAYTVFSVSVWLAPSIISVLGARSSMALATIGYIFYLMAFNIEEAWTMYTGAVVVGVSEALLWTSQGHYLVTNSEPHTVNRNLGIFWVIFSSAELYGNIFVYYKLEGKKYIDAETRKTVIYVMSSIAAASLLMFTVLGGSKDTEDHKEGPVQALKRTWHIFNTPDMRVLLITFMFIGMQQAFRSGIYSASVGFTLKFGDSAKQLVVLSGVFLGTGELVGGVYQIWLSGWTKRHMFGQCWVLGTGLLCQLVAYTTMCLNLPADSVFGNTLDQSYLDPSAVLAMMCSFLLGFADCCCHTQVYSLMAVMFPEDSSQTCAIYKFTKGLMVALMFYCSNHLNLHQQAAVLGPCAVIANIAFYKVTKNVVRAVSQQGNNDLQLETIKKDISAS